MKNSIWNNLLQPDSSNIIGGVNNSKEGFVYFKKSLTLGASAGDSVVFPSLIVPQGFYLRLLNMVLTGDGDNTLYSSFVSMTPQGLAEKAFDFPTNPVGALPNGLVIISSQGISATLSGEITIAQEYLVDSSIIPAQFQVNAQCFANSNGGNQNILYILFGVLLRDINDDCLRVQK